MESISLFVDALVYGKLVLTTSEDGIATAQVLCAMNESAKSV
ncbi:MAG: hypothetical protein AAF702_32385 [Chloroflexota bacterium]